MSSCAVSQSDTSLPNHINMLTERGSNLLFRYILLCKIGMTISKIGEQIALRCIIYPKNKPDHNRSILPKVMLVETSQPSCGEQTW